jgi:hypothetical protein
MAQIELSRPELCELASVVVVAEVTSDEVRWAAAPDGGIETVVWLHTDDVVHGHLGGGLQLVLAGGAIGDVEQRVEDVPKLAIDGTYLLFLAPSPTGFVIIGGEQGAVRVGDGNEPVEAAIASLGSACAP